MQRDRQRCPRPRATKRQLTNPNGKTKAKDSARVFLPLMAAEATASTAPLWLAWAPPTNIAARSLANVATGELSPIFGCGRGRELGRIVADMTRLQKEPRISPVTNETRANVIQMTLFGRCVLLQTATLADPVPARGLRFRLGHQRLGDGIQSETCSAPGTQSRPPRTWPTLAFRVRRISCSWRGHKAEGGGTSSASQCRGPPFRIIGGVPGAYVDGRPLCPQRNPPPPPPPPPPPFHVLSGARPHLFSSFVLSTRFPGAAESPPAPDAGVPGFIQRCPNDQCWSMPMAERAELDDLPAPSVPARGPLLATVIDLGAQFFGIAPKDVKAPRPIKSAAV